MTVQYIIIGIAVVLSAAYVAYRVFNAIRHAGDPCYGCAGCALKDIQRKKHKNKKAKP